MSPTTLEDLNIATPCHANWQEMDGDERSRFCSICKLNVYNLTDMTRRDAEALVNEREGRLCVRFYQRRDGLVLTEDCPVGLRMKRNRFIFSGAAFVTMMASIVFAWSLALRELSVFSDPIADHIADEGMPKPRTQSGPFSGLRDFEFCNRHGEYHLRFVKYDPSNGTFSRGDIIRTAKGIFEPRFGAI